MPRRKMAFVQDYCYHSYNRGVDKRTIFQEKDNYIFALHRVKQYARQFQIAIIALLPCAQPLPFSGASGWR